MKKLINDNTPEVFRILLDELKIKYTTTTIQKLKDDPFFPHIESISSALKSFGINNIIFETAYDKLEKTISKPFIVYTTDYDGMFLVVKAVTSEKVVYVVKENKYETQSKEEFLKKWSGHILMLDVEATQNIKEENYTQNLVREILDKIKIPFLLLTMFGGLYSYFLQFSISLYTILFTIGIVAGLIINIFLLILDINQNNHFVNNICSSLKSKKFSCSGILNTKGASLFGVVKWSHVGFVHFISLLILLIVSKASIACMSLISLLSVAAFCYPFYSIYYQWVVAKKWCKLCLFIQTVLTYLCAVSVFFLTSSTPLNINFRVFFYFVSIIVTVAVIISLILPLIKKNHTNTSKIKLLNSFKYNSRVFSMFFKDEKKVTFETLQGNFINYGDKNGRNEIAIIINPRCNYCITTHNSLLKILRQFKGIRISEIFFVPLNDKEISYEIALKMVDIYLSRSESYFIEALSEYYKKYLDRPQKWMHKYWHQEYKQANSKEILAKHRIWCEEQGIDVTPKIIVNNSFLPQGYTVEDLKYFL